MGYPVENSTGFEEDNLWNYYPFRGNEQQYLEKFEEILVQPWEWSDGKRTFAGYLVCKPTRVKTIAGNGVNKNSWEFEVWGPEADIEAQENRVYRSKEDTWVIQDYYFTIQPFNFFQQKAFCGCGCEKIITGLCLPETLIESFTGLMEKQKFGDQTELRSLFMQEFSTALLASDRRYWS